MKQTQKAWVIERLKASGEISRNECLGQRITRLAHYINLLKKEGWEFETEERDGNYIYKLLDAPKKKTQVVSYVEKDGVKFAHVEYVYQ